MFLRGIIFVILLFLCLGCGGSQRKDVFVKPTAVQLQQALKNAGLYKGKLDGKIGPKTLEAIKLFQTNKGLKVDGEIGRDTWEKLKSYLK
ncbi:MAG: peptidoglycan-binding protein [Candidatus Omnitrophica bacterium]|nr:peptidoglycan-binding protein [Candidatus Omnitrophota bacterium]